MKLRESGMPEETYWETLLDVEGTLDRLGIDSTLPDVVELGCGYGTFTIPIAKRISGALTTFDIDPAMIERTNKRATEQQVPNLLAVLRDVAVQGFGLPDASQDACLLFNILHCEQPVTILDEAARIVRPGGLVLITHWRYDPATPRGPSLDIRPKPEQIAAWANETKRLIQEGETLTLPPWHYGMRFRRLES